MLQLLQNSLRDVKVSTVGIDLVECSCNPMLITSIVVKLPRLDLNVEMSWYHSLVQSVGQYVVTLLSAAMKLQAQHGCIVCEHKWSKYPLVQGNPLAMLGCQLRDSTLFV